MKQDFLSLYDEYFDDVYRYVYFKIGNKWDTDDIVSEVFQRAYEKYGTVKNNPKAWLFVITRNTITDNFRRKKQIPFDDIDQFLCIDQIVQNSEYNHLVEEEIYQCLKTSLLCLEEEELEIIKLKYFANLKYRDIGLLLAKREDLVKTRAHRIIKKLRVLLKQCIGG